MFSSFGEMLMLVQMLLLNLQVLSRGFLSCLSDPFGIRVHSSFWHHQFSFLKYSWKSFTKLRRQYLKMFFLMRCYC
uniref:Secreted protein n=1 Tax=Arundo donax TaxID=35708 RepID=A0A0A9DDV9_ARUDO